MAGKNKRYPKPASLPSDELDRIIGGMGDIVTLFRVECGRCGKISETLPTMPDLSFCPICGAGREEFIRYAFVVGEWIKVEP